MIMSVSAKLENQFVQAQTYGVSGCVDVNVFASTHTLSEPKPEFKAEIRDYGHARPNETYAVLKTTFLRKCAEANNSVVNLFLTIEQAQEIHDALGKMLEPPCYNSAFDGDEKAHHFANIGDETRCVDCDCRPAGKAADAPCKG